MTDVRIAEAHDTLDRAKAEDRDAEYLILTVREYAKRERLHPITVYRHIQQGRIKAIRHGRAIRIRLKRAFAPAATL